MDEVGKGFPCEPLMLSKREADVIGCIFEGQGQEQIAETLGMTVGTVKKVKDNIFKKAKVNSAIKLVNLAWRNGGFLY